MCSPFGGGAICWRSVKQVGVADSTMEAGFIAALEVAVQAELLSNFLMDKGLVPSVQSVVTTVIAKQLQGRRNQVSIR